MKTKKGRLAHVTRHGKPPCRQRCVHSSASQLARAGLLDARDDQVLKIADRMFATAYRPFCPDGF